MNLPNLRTWSERQQVVAIIVMAGAALAALWFFLLLPQNRKRRELESEISNMRSQLASGNYLVGERALQERKSDEVTYNETLYREWTNMVGRMSIVGQMQDATNAVVGHIDYKVALFDVRQRLMRKSREKDIRLRHTDLGMNDAVYSDEDARKLMLQLRTVEKLVDFTLDLHINTLRDINPLPPIEHRASSKQVPFVEEYPVELEFYGSIENLYQLFNAMTADGNAFVLRRLRVRAEPSDPRLLRINAVMGTLVFLKDPRNLVEIPVSATRRTTPYGF